MRVNGEIDVSNSPQISGKYCCRFNQYGHDTDYIVYNSSMYIIYSM